MTLLLTSNNELIGNNSKEGIISGDHCYSHKKNPSRMEGSALNFTIQFCCKRVMSNCRCMQGFIRFDHIIQMSNQLFCHISLSVDTIPPSASLPRVSSQTGWSFLKSGHIFMHYAVASHNHTIVAVTPYYR